MRPQRKIMMVETTHAFVKLKQIKAAVSAGGIKFKPPAGSFAPFNEHCTLECLNQVILMTYTKLNMGTICTIKIVMRGVLRF